MKLSVIIPSYNEEKTLPILLEKDGVVALWTLIKYRFVD
jgi:hypothetical protein